MHYISKVKSKKKKLSTVRQLFSNRLVGSASVTSPSTRWAALAETEGVTKGLCEEEANAGVCSSILTVTRLVWRRDLDVGRLHAPYLPGVL